MGLRRLRVPLAPPLVHRPETPQVSLVATAKEELAGCKNYSSDLTETAAGMRIVNVLPWPASLWTEMLPPWVVTIP